MEKNLKRGRETGVDTLWRVPKIGRRLHKCNFYETDSFLNDDNNMVLFEVSIAEAMTTTNEKQAACCIGSALCAFCPYLVPIVKNALEEFGMDLTVIKLPSGANNAGVKLENYENYTRNEIYTLIGSWLMIILKRRLSVDVSIINYMVSGLAEELGVPNEKIAVLKSHFQLPKVMAIRNAYYANIALKDAVQRVIFWLCERNETAATMASYVVKKDRKLTRVRETGDDALCDTFWRVPKIGRRLHKCNFYEADNLVNDDDNTVLFNVSFAEAMRTSDGTQAACYLGSPLCAFCPNLASVVKDTLEEYGIDLIVIKLPSGANNAGVKLDDYVKYDPIEIYTLIGSWLIILFHGVSESNISCTVSSLAEELGVPNEKIPALNSHFQFTQVMVIRNAFCANVALENEVKKFLSWLSNRNETVATMARYILPKL